MWRKAYSTMSIVEEFISSIVGESANPEATSSGMPDLNVPVGVNPMDAYGPE